MNIQTKLFGLGPSSVVVSNDLITDEGPSPKHLVCMFMACAFFVQFSIFIDD